MVPGGSTVSSRRVRSGSSTLRTSIAGGCSGGAGSSRYVGRTWAIPCRIAGASGSGPSGTSTSGPSA